MVVKGKYAMCVGATAGIGRAIALRLAQLEANVTVVGRNSEAGNAILEQLKREHPSGDHSFVTIDASSMKSISKGCESYLKNAQSNPLHYLVMTQGIASVSGRIESAEGIESKLAVHYYGRVLFQRQLAEKLKKTALQPEDNDVRVLSILSGGVHSPYTNFEDLDLKKSYSIRNAADAAGFYTDLAMDQLSRDTEYLITAGIDPMSESVVKRGISFIHAAPGIVKTTWGKDFPFYLNLPIRVLQQFAKSPEECAEMMVQHGLMGGARWGQGFHVMGAKGEQAKLTDAHTDENREKVWAHTNQVIERALNSK